MTLLYLQYEKALTFQDYADSLATIVSCSISRSVLATCEGVPMAPKWPFDMYYFYGSVCREIGWWLGMELKKPFDHGAKIVPANVPNLAELPWRDYAFVKRGLAARYLESVTRDATPGGMPFDMHFALHIACQAVDGEMLEDLPERIEYLEKNPPPSSVDEWLAAFDAPRHDKPWGNKAW